MSSALLVFVSFVLVAWLLVGMFRSRSARQKEPVDGEAAPGSRKDHGGLLRVVLFLFVVWLVIDVVAILVLGSNSQNTFSYVPAQKEQQKPPR